jgi:hypothetical protein
MTTPRGTGAGDGLAPSEFPDFVIAGVEILEAHDRDFWTLGELASEFEIKLGRPDDPTAPTLADLSKEWDTSTSNVSRWRNNHNFYPDNLRTFAVSYSHYDLARRAHPKDMEEALELLSIAQSQALGIRAFKRYIKGIYIETLIKVTELPKRLQGLVPTGVSEVWVRVEKPKEA